MSGSDRALVLGLGSSGEAAARLLRRQGAAVTAVDRADTAALRGRADALRAEGVAVVLAADRLPAGAWDRCVVSPGVPADSAWLAEARGRGAEVLSELELGFRDLGCAMLAVTGANGKSTLVKLCGEALARAGLRVAMAGNYGDPLSAVASGSSGLDWVVVEVSSFQLEHVERFRPRVGVVLNLHPNHLDRHRNLDTYRRLKARLFGAMEADDAGIADADDLALVRGLAGGRNRWRTFGAAAAADCRYADGRVEFCGPGPRALDFSGTRFANPVMGLTAAAAVAAVSVCGLDPAVVLAAARAFEPLPHRMNEVAVIRGVRFVDDSKATTLAALRAAVIMTGGGVRLVAGGILKETDTESVKESLAKRVKSIYLVGSAAKALAASWGDSLRCVVCGELAAATRAAWAEAEPGDTVLLAPGCSSFDQFSGFAERGDAFARVVCEIREES